MKIRETTTTTLVEEALRVADDFLTAAMLAEMVKRNRDQVKAALKHFRQHRVADCIEQEHRLWWFMLPPENDTRTCIVCERAPETKPRVMKKRRVVKLQGEQNAEKLET